MKEDFNINELLNNNERYPYKVVFRDIIGNESTTNL
jgi:hypothetical protein